MSTRGTDVPFSIFRSAVRLGFTREQDLLVRIEDSKHYA